MALADSVTTSLKDAESSLRNALAYSARSERPFVCKTISEMIENIDRLIRLDDMLDQMEDLSKNLKE
jgi:hypothetical protein